MTECSEFFERLDAEYRATGTAKNRCRTLREQQRHERLMEWESETASVHSPGPVQGAEALRKALYEGRDIRDGDLVRTAFASLDSVGFSGDRNFADVRESHARAEARATAEMPLVGYVEVSVSHLRSFQLSEKDQEPKQAIGVYDTALPGNDSHAEGFLIAKSTGTVPMKSIEADLMDKHSAAIIAWPTALDDGGRTSGA
jgi:hypothetical protein